MSHPVRFSIPLLLIVSACSSTPKPVASVAPPPPVAVAIVPMPTGASPGMAVPAMLADGSYPTPNRNLSPAAATWHLRAALNVAALACRGPLGDAIAARYNTAIRAHAPVLAHAESRFAEEFRAVGGDWRNRYDGEMTKLYNFFALAPVRADFCATADRVLDEMTSVAPAALPGFAQAHMAAIDRPFTDFYRAYDAWRNQRSTATLAMAAATSTGPRVPYLKVDPAVFRLP
ncbi:hypothetical protein [Sphingomonas bacterium]|uniref:hypothetical protein n=1 Tax=Sphingomonas bacterium TaxID=1895847 RepID=UPI00260CE016|nr:hypothetical protein [Sphingomonas bacterium]MDB5679913.1 hypothetical protein [Sphingomonas bacterium]